MNDRLARYQKGHHAEKIARYFLNGKFYRLRELRYKTKLGEIDLIVTKGKTIVFCEVKARNDLTAGVEAISAKAQERIQRAAALYCQHNPIYQDYDWRFDVVVVRPWRLPYHLKDAWRP